MFSLRAEFLPVFPEGGNTGKMSEEFVELVGERVELLCEV